MITSDPSSSSSKNPDTAAELVAMVDELVSDLSVKFSKVSGEIFTKMDDMARRLDALEAVLTEAETSTEAPGLAAVAEVTPAAAAAAIPLPGTPAPEGGSTGSST